jgi:Zn-dependent oligopeptidase
MFNKFHHLFEYDATYYSYLVAKVASQKLFRSQENEKIGEEIRNLFSKGAMFDFRDITKCCF